MLGRISRLDDCLCLLVLDGFHWCCIVSNMLYWFYLVSIWFMMFLIKSMAFNEIIGVANKTMFCSLCVHWCSIDFVVFLVQMIDFQM